MIVENKVSNMGRTSRKSVAPMDTTPRLIKVTFENAVPSRSTALEGSASAVRNGNDDEPLAIRYPNLISQTFPMRSMPDFQPHQLELLDHDADYYHNQGETPNFNSGTMGPPNTSSLQPWNPALLLNPTGKHHNAAQPAQSPSGFHSGPSPQPNLAFEFSNTNGSGLEDSLKPEYSFQYSNANQFSSSKPGSGSSESPYSIPHHMANGPPHSSPNSVSNFTSIGMGSMIERMNNVQDRSTVPVAKRQKMMGDDDSESGRNNGFSSGSSGLLAGYVKDKQRAAASASGQTHATLDLTGGTWPPPL